MNLVELERGRWHRPIRPLPERREPGEQQKDESHRKCRAARQKVRKTDVRPLKTRALTEKRRIATRERDDFPNAIASPSSQQGRSIAKSRETWRPFKCSIPSRICALGGRFD
jgi:hypothetical protein